MPLGRFGKAEEVADAVIFLLSDSSSLFLGQTLNPNAGGIHAMTKVISVREAVELVKDGQTVVVGGSGAGHALPQRFIDELETVFKETGHPRDLTTVRVVGTGDFADRGFSPARPARDAPAHDRLATSATSRALARWSRTTSWRRTRSRRACCPS